MARKHTSHLVPVLVILAVSVAAAAGFGYWFMGVQQAGRGDAGTRDAQTAGQVIKEGDKLAEPGSVPIGGPFTLTDHTGATVTDEDFRDRYKLVFFGFTHCPDVCPTSMADIARTLDLLGEQAGAVQPLFVSVDPARDTPEALAEFVNAFHPRIVGLTGTEAQIDRITDEYKVFFEKVGRENYNEGPSQNGDDDEDLGDDYLVNHSGNTYLMSPGGDYLTHFSYGTEPEKMAETIREAIARFGTPNA